MNKIQRLIVSIRVVIHLWKMGFYFSANDHHDKPEENLLGKHWGFYRLNWTDGDMEFYSILDVDFAEKIGGGDFVKYFHLHNDDTIFRVDTFKTHKKIEHPK